MNWLGILEIARALRLQPVPHSLGGGIHIWQADLDHVELASDGLLSPEEVSRRQKFYFQQDAHRYGRSRAILRMLLGAATDQHPLQVLVETDRLGKPHCSSSPQVEFNLSHSGNIVAYAVSDAAPVGVDIELYARWSESEILDLAQQCMTQGENEAIKSTGRAAVREAFFRCWTRKEACLKAVGCGLSLEPSGLEVGIGLGNRRVELTYSGTIYQVDVESIDEIGTAALAIAVVRST